MATASLVSRATYHHQGRIYQKVIHRECQNAASLKNTDVVIQPIKYRANARVERQA